MTKQELKQIQEAANCADLLYTKIRYLGYMQSVIDNEKIEPDLTRLQIVAEEVFLNLVGIRTGKPINYPIMDSRLKEDVAKVIQWVNPNFRKSHELCTEYTSYGLKHIVEKQMRAYISEDALIEAMKMLGYKFKKIPSSRSLHFFVDTGIVELFDTTTKP